MRYVSYSIDDVRHVGILDGDSVTPLAGIKSIAPATGIDELRNAAPEPRHTVKLGDVALLPASPQPRRIICVGLNYRDHVSETGRETPAYPVLFSKFASNLLSAHADIVLPAESSQPDYEGELAVIIGRAGRRIAQADALHHVLGYAVANDVTMRDFQYKTHQWMQGKAWDDSTPLGPAVVTPDEVDLAESGIRTILNGTVVQEAQLSDLMFAIPRLIADISLFTGLEAGDVILTGTPGGVGFRRDPQVFLRPGDIIAVEVDGVGRIENRVVEEPSRAP